MNQIYAVASGKGGCGKTSVCALLGDSLARRGKRVLLVETDAGLRALDIMLHVNEQAAFDLADVLCGRCCAEKAIVPCAYNAGLFVLSAPFDHRFLPPVERFVEQIRSFAADYDIILIDTPAGVGGMLAASVAACDTALLVVTPDPVCIRDAARIRQLLREHAGCGVRLLINRFHPRRLVLPDLDTVIDTVGAQLLGIIPEDPLVYRSTCSGQLLPPDSHAGRAFANVAARIAGERIPLLFP